MNKEKDLNGTDVTGGGWGQSPKIENHTGNQYKSLWWLAGFVLALTLLAVILATI